MRDIFLDVGFVGLFRLEDLRGLWMEVGKRRRNAGGEMNGGVNGDEIVGGVSFDDGKIRGVFNAGVGVFATFFWIS